MGPKWWEQRLGEIVALPTDDRKSVKQKDNRNTINNLLESWSYGTWKWVIVPRIKCCRRDKKEAF